MATTPDDWRSEHTAALFEAILSLKSVDESERFFRDLCTLGELRDLAQRWAVVRMLDQGLHYAEISRQTGASTATITRIASWLRHGEGGYQAMLVRQHKKGREAGQNRSQAQLDPTARTIDGPIMRERLRLAVPNKGRMVEPTLGLLHDAGLVFEEHDRSLVARVSNFALDILFVRTNDVIEFVGDGVADLGITGIDLLSETAAELPRVRSLGYGKCRLAAAVPADSPATTISDLAGLRVATAHPNTTRRFFAEQQIDVEVIPISGAVEVAPRLGLSDAIVDLVSTGSTLVMNGLRQVGDVLASEAVLVANPTALVERSSELGSIETMLSAVIAARGQKYLMMNAPSDHLVELTNLLPGLGSPSVIPLADDGMIAIHAVVEADAVWSLLPRLKAAGASGILVLPIEKIVA